MVLHYPEFPPDMPWLGFSDYESRYDAQFVNVDFDFTTTWEDVRARFGWKLHELLRLDGDGAVGDLPAEFRFQASACCGGGERN